MKERRWEVGELFRIDLTPEDEFVVMGSDGVWDVISDQKSVDIVAKAKPEVGEYFHRYAAVREAAEPSLADRAEAMKSSPFKWGPLNGAAGVRSIGAHGAQHF